MKSFKNGVAVFSTVGFVFVLGTASAGTQTQNASAKFLKACASEITEHCKTAKADNAKAAFECLEKYENDLRTEKRNKDCYEAHEAYEKTFKVGEKEENEEHHKKK